MTAPDLSAAFAAALGPLLREVVRGELAELELPERLPTLLDRAALARELGTSTRQVDRLRAEPGFPELRVVDAPRFILADVLAWLRERCAASRGAP